MKKALSIYLTLMLWILITSPALAEQWQKVDKGSFGWSAVTTLANGEPMPATDVVRYNVFMRDRKTGIAAEVLHEILENQATVTVAAETFVHVGVQSVRYVSVDGLIPSNEEPYLSEISWSSDPAVCFDAVTFGFRNHVPPGNPGGLRLLQ